MIPITSPYLTELPVIVSYNNLMFQSKPSAFQYKYKEALTPHSNLSMANALCICKVDIYQLVDNWS